ncbi:hypothetical protein KSS87_007144, partial [Heliosperma pusillum]
RGGEGGIITSLKGEVGNFYSLNKGIIRLYFPFLSIFIFNPFTSLHLLVHLSLLLP